MDLLQSWYQRLPNLSFSYLCVCAHFVTSNSLWSHSPPGFSVHWTSQVRIPEWVAISCPRRSSHPRGYSRPSSQTCISCISRQILYHWATWVHSCKINAFSQLLFYLTFQLRTVSSLRTPHSLVCMQLIFIRPNSMQPFLSLLQQILVVFFLLKW